MKNGKNYIGREGDDNGLANYSLYRLGQFECVKDG